MEGDPLAQKGNMSEADAIVLEQKLKLENSGEKLDRIPSDMIAEEDEPEQEPGPELNADALEAARKDRKPQVPSA